jgi:hypothetical protein
MEDLLHAGFGTAGRGQGFSVVGAARSAGVGVDG